MKRSLGAAISAAPPGPTPPDWHGARQACTRRLRLPSPRPASWTASRSLSSSPRGRGGAATLAEACTMYALRTPCCAHPPSESKSRTPLEQRRQRYAARPATPACR
eukprot:11629902-Alexandrium_andersonii.AAC.1